MYGIDKRVWRAIGRPAAGPALVALAASVCPQLLDQGLKLTLPKSLADIERSDLAVECHGDSADRVIRNALAAWAETFDCYGIGADRSIRSLAHWDLKLGVWCAAAVAETALQYVPDGEDRPRNAIEAARAWTVGRARVSEVRKAQLSLRDMGSRATFSRATFGSHASASMAAFFVMESVTSGDFMTQEYSTGNAAVYAALAASSARDTNENVERQNLSLTVAAAIMSFPTGDIVASRGLSSRTLIAGAAGLAMGAGIMRIARRR